MINALKSLQEKVRALELEREAAATRYERMREDTAEHLRLASTPLKRSQVRKERREQDDHDLKLSQKADSNAAILKAQLSNQDRELHYLREVLQKTEKDKLDLQAHNEELIRQQSELEEKELRLKSTEQQRQPSRAPLHQFEEETGQVGDQRSPPVSDFTPLKPIGSHSNQHLAEIREDYDGLHGRLIELEKKLKREQMERHRIQNDYSLVCNVNIGKGVSVIPINLNKLVSFIKHLNSCMHAYVHMSALGSPFRWLPFFIFSILLS